MYSTFRDTFRWYWFTNYIRILHQQFPANSRLRFFQAPDRQLMTRLQFQNPAKDLLRQVILFFKQQLSAISQQGTNQTDVCPNLIQFITP